MPPRKKGPRGGRASAATTKRQTSSTPSTGAAASALDPVSTAGVRWIVPDTVSLALTASQTAGACIRRLFFDSREWVTPLRADVAALLAAFEAKYDGTQSPIELMKQLWGETGWKWVLLLGCPEGKVRLDWGNSIARAFLGAYRNTACLVMTVSSIMTTRVESADTERLPHSARRAPARGYGHSPLAASRCHPRPVHAESDMVRRDGALPLAHISR